MPKRIAIVGAGVAGLSLAEALDRLSTPADPIEVTVLERTGRAGGNVRTERIDGYLCEHGPNGFLDNSPPTLALIQRLGLEPIVFPSSSAARHRFVFARGRLREIPTSPFAFARSDLLSLGGKLRVLAEPLAPGRCDPDESIHDFAARRIGPEAATMLVDPMVSGVFAGDAQALSLRACFPKMWEMETQHGSLVRAMLAIRRQRRARARDVESGFSRTRAAVESGFSRTSSNGEMGAPGGCLTSFCLGMQQLIDGLVRAMAPKLWFGVTVARLEQVRTPTGSTAFTLDLAGLPSLTVDAVVLAGPAAQSSRLLQPFDPTLAEEIGKIAAAPLVVLCLGYARASVDRSLDGFGFLVPRGMGPRALGVLWDSSIYAGRAPAGHVLFRAIYGGAHDPAAITLSDEELLRVARADLEVTMNLRAAPVFTRIVRHPVGIPQYTIGHLERLDRIEARLQSHPGLFVAGNSYRGVSMNACIADAEPLARRVVGAITAAAGPRAA